MNIQQPAGKSCAWEAEGAEGQTAPNLSLIGSARSRRTNPSWDTTGTANIENIHHLLGIQYTLVGVRHVKLAE